MRAKSTTKISSPVDENNEKQYLYLNIWSLIPFQIDCRDKELQVFSFLLQTANMTRMIRKSIIALGTTHYVRSAIDSQADLKAFRDKPTPILFAGLFAMAFSYVIGWPVIAILGYLSVKLDNPWLVGVGGPFAYGMSHLVFLLGMYLSGTFYGVVFLRWFTRVTMEKLLTWADR